MYMYVNMQRNKRQTLYWIRNSARKRDSDDGSLDFSYPIGLRLIISILLMTAWWNTIFFMNKRSGNITDIWSFHTGISSIGHLIWRHYRFNPPFDQSQWEGVRGNYFLKLMPTSMGVLIFLPLYLIFYMCFQLWAYFKDFFRSPDLAFFWLVGVFANCKLCT